MKKLEHKKIDHSKESILEACDVSEGKMKEVVSTIPNGDSVKASEVIEHLENGLTKRELAMLLFETSRDLLDVTSTLNAIVGSNLEPPKEVS